MPLRAIGFLKTDAGMLLKNQVRTWGMVLKYISAPRLLHLDSSQQPCLIIGVVGQFVETALIRDGEVQQSRVPPFAVIAVRCGGHGVLAALPLEPDRLDFTARTEDDRHAYGFTGMVLHGNYTVVRKRETTLPMIVKSVVPGMTMSGSNRSFSGWRRMVPFSRKKRLTVASPSTRATTTSPLSAVDWERINTRSPGSMPAFFMESPLMRRKKVPPLAAMLLSSERYSAIASKGISGAPARTVPTIGRDTESVPPEGTGSSP